MNDIRYWIWLQQALGEGACIKQILEDFSTPKKLYNSNILEWRMSASLTTRQIARMEKLPLSVADEAIYACKKNNWNIITFDDSRYPQRLREIPDPPAVLYVDGDLPDIDNSVVIGMVGARRASEYAVKVTSIMAQGVSEAGALVISGGALGVDTAAHKGALAAGGKTIAVLGCGLGSNYLRENEFLRRQIRENGALVTEFVPFTGATKFTFPMRNRIISGLSLGVLVAEASVRSGSLITARFALEQGKDVYAIPGSVLAVDFEGTNKLIDDGAYVVTKPVHLLEQYTERFRSIDINKVRSVESLMNATADHGANLPKTQDIYSIDHMEEGREKRQVRETNQAGLSDVEKKVLDCLTDTYIHINLLTEKTSLTKSAVLAALTRLEILDLAKSAIGKRYKLS